MNVIAIYEGSKSGKQDYWIFNIKDVPVVDSIMCGNFYNDSRTTDWIDQTCSFHFQEAKIELILTDQSDALHSYPIWVETFNLNLDTQKINGLPYPLNYDAIKPFFDENPMIQWVNYNIHIWNGKMGVVEKQKTPDYGVSFSVVSWFLYQRKKDFII